MDDEPQVGIFWCYQNELFYCETAPLSKGVKTQISVDYEIGHFTAWYLMEKKGILKKLPVQLRSEYDSIPRGRVVYLIEDEKFIVYHGDEFNDDLYDKILERFKLPRNQTISDIDMHYNPLPDDFIF